MADKLSHERRQAVTTLSERPTATRDTTVRCALPEDAATTLRLAGTARAHPPAMPAQRFDDAGAIGRGGMSEVRKVWDRLILRAVAMKVLDPSRTLDELTRFVEEAQITGQLDHPNIVPVHDLALDDQGLPTRFMMKLVEGQTLLQVLAPRGESQRELAPEALESLLQVFLKVCDAVSFAHSRGVIHRDLKPGNIMIGSFGQVYVMDWGLAMLASGARPSEAGGSAQTHASERGQTLRDAPGTLSGTPAYMAPEQALGRIAEVDERTDVYGLGGILYQVLTLRPPHDGQDADDDLALARAGAVLPPEQAATERSLPPLLCEIALKALAPRREDRYPSVAALKADVESFLRGGGWFSQRRFAPGEVIVREGEEADAAYILTSGQCELLKTVDGEMRFLKLLAPGEVFGETAIFGSSRRTATIRAHDEVTVLVVTREALTRELGRSTWLGAFVQALAQRFVDLDRKLTQLSSDSKPPKMP